MACMSLFCKEVVAIVGMMKHLIGDDEIMDLPKYLFNRYLSYQIDNSVQVNISNLIYTYMARSSKCEKFGITMEPTGLHLTINYEEFFVGLKERIVRETSMEELKAWLKEVQVSNLNPDEILQTSVLKELLDDFRAARQNNRLGKLAQLKEWFSHNAHIPEPPEYLIYKFLWTANDDEHQAKKAMMKYYSIRGEDDEIFGERDPFSQGDEQTFQTAYFAVMPFYTDKMYRVTISRLRDFNVDKFSSVHWIRHAMYLSDLRISTDLALGEMLIFDLTGFSISHLFRFTISLVKKMVIALESASPVKVKQIHLVNSPAIVDKTLAFFTPFLKEKIRQRIVVHTNGFDKLHEYIHPKILPAEFGGFAGPLVNFSCRWEKEIKKNRNMFLNEEKKIKRLYQEGKKKGTFFGLLFGWQGNFKKIDID